MIKTGNFVDPKGAVAMIGPSDLDTDTKFNNVICGDVWDNLLENRISETSKYSTRELEKIYTRRIYTIKS